MASALKENIYRIKSQAVQQIINQCNECKLSAIDSFVNLINEGDSQLSFYTLTDSAFKILPNHIVDIQGRTIKIGKITIIAGTRQGVMPYYNFLRITDQDGVFVIPILLNYDLNWFQFQNLDQYMDYELKLLENPRIIEIDTSKKNTSNTSILGLIINMNLRGKAQGCICLFNQLSTLHAGRDFQAQLLEDLKTNEKCDQSQIKLTNRVFDFNILNNETHKIHEKQHEIVSKLNINLLGSDPIILDGQQQKTLQTYLGSLNGNIKNMARMTLTEFQGFLFNIMFILRFNTSIPLSYYNFEISEEGTRISLILNQEPPKVNKLITIKEWITQALKDYLQTEVDNMIVYDVMRVPDNQYNINNQIEQIVTYKLQIGR